MKRFFDALWARCPDCTNTIAVSFAMVLLLMGTLAVDSLITRRVVRETIVESIASARQYRDAHEDAIARNQRKGNRNVMEALKKLDKTNGSLTSHDGTLRDILHNVKDTNQKVDAIAASTQP